MGSSSVTKIKQRWKFRNFTADEVRVIRASAKSMQALATIYSVSKCTIWKIKNRISYEDIPDHDQESNPAN